MTKDTPTILYEDQDVLVINKPASMLVHDDGVAAAATVVNWFVELHPQAAGVGEPGLSPKGESLDRSGIVHRLDRDTSGVLILAKHQDAFAHLKEQFQTRQVAKEYHAIIYGAMSGNEGTIDRPIGRSPSDFRKRSAMRGAKGRLREAVTHWSCLQTGSYEGETFSYLAVRPVTGRTHQIRVHLRALERPIVQDPLYATHMQNRSNHLQLEGLALHAYSLTLQLPNGEERSFVAPVPQSFIEARARLI